MKEAKKQEKLAAGKTLEVAKSVVTLQVKPWDDETDMEALEAAVRAIEKDGLLWGKSKLVPVGYGESPLSYGVWDEIADEQVSACCRSTWSWRTRSRSTSCRRRSRRSRSTSSRPTLLVSSIFRWSTCGNLC
jgi:translation elongation factor EF-1beta